jgi:hypothetical protein
MKMTLGLIAVGAMLSATAVDYSAQSVQSLAALTVPAERLPSGCRLQPVDPKATGAARFVMYPGVRENPWIGTRRPTLANLRRMIDGPTGPTYGLSGPALHERLADDVVEGYRARYIAADEAQVDVYAVRFNDPALIRAAVMNRLITDPPERPRVVVGATAALIFQSSIGTRRRDGGVADDACLRAITEHIAAAK